MNSDNNLVVTCELPDNYSVRNGFETVVSGIVNDAKMADYNLFPIFKGWINDNIFYKKK